MKATVCRCSAILGAVLIMSMAGAASAKGALDRIRDTQSITIAHRDASVPFSYLDDGKPIGYAVDLCLKIADAVRRELKLPALKIKYLSVTPSTRIPAIMNGEADLECGSTTNNVGRREQVAFTIPHFLASARMVARADAGIRNWVDLRNKRVVTTSGTTTVMLLNDRDKVRALNLKLIEGRDHAESFSMVERSEAEVFVMDDVLLYGLRANAKVPERFLVMGDALSAEPYAIMLPKGDAEFKSIVDLEMARIIHDGEIYQIYKKWFETPIPPKGINMNMPMGYLLRGIFRYPTDKVGD